MISKYKTKQLKLNTDLRGLKEGKTVDVKVDKDGTPIDRYWRDRVKDSKLDKCVEFVKGSKKRQKDTAVVE